MTLEDLGWTAEWANKFVPFLARNFVPARIAAEHRELYEILTPVGIGTAVVTGKLRHEAIGRISFPIVGDWVATEPTTGGGPSQIHAIVPRRNKFSRKVAGEQLEEQPIAANIDTLFLVTSLNRDLNPQRLERYVAAAAHIDAEIVLLLTKSDLASDPESLILDVRRRVPYMAVHAISAYAGVGLDSLAPYLRKGKTVSLVGSSGVGKSTLINRLLGSEVFATSAVREADDRGRHTTTSREMVLLPGGGLLIDNPGMRELQLWNEDANVEAAFGDIESLAQQCYFTDCKHRQEPHCAVKAAIESGRLEPARLENFQKMQREVAFLDSKGDRVAEQERKRYWKEINRAQYREHQRRDRERFG